MKIIISTGPHTDEVIQKAYQYILKVYRREMQKKEMQEALKSGKTEEEFRNEYLKKRENYNAENKG